MAKYYQAIFMQDGEIGTADFYQTRRARAEGTLENISINYPEAHEEAREELEALASGLDSNAADYDKASSFMSAVLVEKCNADLYLLDIEEGDFK